MLHVDTAYLYAYAYAYAHAYMHAQTRLATTMTHLSTLIQYLYLGNMHVLNRLRVFLFDVLNFYTLYLAVTY